MPLSRRRAMRYGWMCGFRRGVRGYSSMKQRLQKLLAAAGVASRRHVEEMIRQGRVSVNGKVGTELPILLDPANDRVTVDGEGINLKPREAGPRLYILMNK